MFIREKKSKDKSTSVIQIVENTRVGSTTKQQVIRHIGTAKTKDEVEQLKRLAQITKVQLENETLSKQSKNTKHEFAMQAGRLTPLKQSLIDISKLKEIKRYVLGIHNQSAVLSQ